MVLGWKDGENPVIKGILDKIASLESKVKLLESENKALKSEISKLSNGNPCTEWRDMLIGKKNISENQAIIINAVGSEQNNRKSRENNVVLFGVPTSKAATEEERVKEDEIITREILNEIGVPMDEQEAAKIKRFKSKSTATKSLPIRVTFGGNLDETLRTEIVVSQVLKQAKELYQPTNTTITGHSLSGAIGAGIASKKDKLYTFNPAYTIGQKTRSKKGQHEVFRTGGDIVSLLGANSKNMHTPFQSKS